MNFDLFTGTTVSIYTILTPIIGAAIMIGMTPTATLEERIRISRQACTVAGVLLMIFAIAGNFIMVNIFRISTEAFQVGGGLYLLTISAGMVLKKEEQKDEGSQTQPAQQSANNIAITPIGTPLLTGPGTITATLVKKSAVCNTFFDTIDFFLALTLVMFLSYLTFVVSCKFAKLLTPKILGIVERSTGIILACMSLESIIAGITTFLLSPAML
ncbi:MAG: MarC family protein [Puniceicoccales bacterium]|nr:MarC family protein [Puniceicoccales bacterium]